MSDDPDGPLYTIDLLPLFAGGRLMAGARASVPSGSASVCVWYEGDGRVEFSAGGRRSSCSFERFVAALAEMCGAPLS